MTIVRMRRYRFSQRFTQCMCFANQDRATKRRREPPWRTDRGASIDRLSDVVVVVVTAAAAGLA